MVDYMEREALQEGTHWYAVARHLLGLRHGQSGARRWRQVWSDHRLKHQPARHVWQLAQQALHAGAGEQGEGPVSAPAYSTAA